MMQIRVPAPLLVILTIVLATLKLTNAIDISWFIVFIPVLIPIFALGLIALLLFICALYGVVKRD
jgi:uncharacterized Tic20 family protein